MLSYTYFFEILIILCFTLIIWCLIIHKNFRSKFLYFILLLLVTCSWGLYYSYDGIIMLLIIAELLILLLFLLMYVTINFELTNINITKIFCYIFIINTFLLYFFIFYLNNLKNIFFMLHINIYEQVLEIISADFFIFFYFFFIIFPHITYIIAILLGLFSIFFIFFYFILKYNQQVKKIHNLNFLFIRKQQLLHQANYKVQLINFQK